MTITKSIVLIAMLSTLTGCASFFQPRIQIERVEVPLPIPCNIIAPKKPSLPLTEIDKAEADLFVWVKAALAEIELRKGYETELEAAITACNSK